MNWATVESAIQVWIATGSGLASDHVIWAEQERAPRPSKPFITLHKTGYQVRGRDWYDVADNLLTVADTVENVDFANNELDLTAHGLATGDGPIQLSTTGTLPTGLAASTDYWVIRQGADAMSLATTLVLANAGTAVAFSDAGSGTHSIASTSETATRGEEITHQVRGVRSLSLSIQCYSDEVVGSNSPMALLNDAITAKTLPSVHAALVTAGVGVASFDQVASLGASLGPVWEPRAVVNCTIFLAEEITETGTYIEQIEDPERI